MWYIHYRVALGMNVTIDMSHTISKCTALVTQQVKRHIQALLLLLCPARPMYSGPAKSTAVYAKGGASFTRNDGRGGPEGGLKDLPSNRQQTTHV